MQKALRNQKGGKLVILFVLLLPALVPVEGLLLRMATFAQAGDDERRDRSGNGEEDVEGDSSNCRGGVCTPGDDDDEYGGGDDSLPMATRPPSGGGWSVSAWFWAAISASKRAMAALVAASASAPSAATVDRKVAFAPAITLLLPGLPRVGKPLPLLPLPPKLQPLPPMPLLLPLLWSKFRGTEAARR